MGGVEAAIKINKSAKFLLPLIAHHKVSRLITNPGFINTYIELPNILIIESDQQSDDWKSTPTLIEEIKLTDNKYLYKCKIPENYQNEFDCFITGRYSSFSKKAKEIICFRNNGSRKNIENTLLYKVLYKTPDRKEFLEERLGVKLGTEAELLSIPDIEEETYGGERIKV